VSAHSEQPHVFIFNINSQTIVDSIPVYDSEWRYPSALVLSSDETKLYLCAFAWPAIGEGFRWGNTGASHADTGRVFEINLSTKNILRTVNVGALPQSIYLTPYNTLLVSTDEEYPIVEPTSPEVLLHTGAFEYLDIIAIPAFQRTARIECNSYPEYFTNTFSPWSDDGRYVAMCNPESFYLPSHPAFNDGIWVIDSYSGAVTSTINIAIGDYRYGARSLIVSHVCDGEAYVALNQCGNSNANRIAVVDHATGDCLGSLDTGTEITPVFMHELPDGRLIVTGGASGKIAIIDPT
jgi:DNA-binding beta-propeller fold protein YncE